MEVRNQGGGNPTDIPRRGGTATIAIQCLAAFALAGCAQVNPEGDYRDAAAIVQRRLDVAEVYQPGMEPLVEQKVGELLANGLTADEAVSVALLNNRSFQSQFQSIGVSRADVVQSGLWTNPSLFIGNRFIEGGGRSELSFGIAQQLVDLWQIPVKERIAEARLKQTVLAVLDAAVNISTATRVQYFDCLWRERLTRIADDNLALARKSLDIAHARLDAGDTSPLDSGLVRTQVIQAENATLLARRDLENARLALALSLGIARTDTPLNLTDAFVDPNIRLASADALVATAMANRFDIQIADAIVEAAAQDVDLELRKVWPSLMIGLEGERSGQRAQPGRKIASDTARASVAGGRLTAPTIESRGQRNLARSQIIDLLLGPSIQVTIPIWDQNQAQIARAGIVYQQRLKDREYLYDVVVTDIRQADNNAKTAMAQFALIQNSLLPQAEANIRAAQGRYEAGEDNVLVLLQAQDAVFSQNRLAADTLRDLLLASAELTRVCGGKLPSSGARHADDAGLDDKSNLDNGRGAIQ